MLRHQFLPVLLLTLVAGCLYEIRDEINDCELQCKNSCCAKMAWHRCSGVYQSIEYRRDFKAGFLSGYSSVAYGSNGCPPSLPPSCYWKTIHTNQTGKARANAWFDGYSHGALAAEADGIAESNRIVTRGGRRTDSTAPGSEMYHMDDMPPPGATPTESLSPTPYAEPVPPVPLYSEPQAALPE